MVFLNPALLGMGPWGAALGIGSSLGSMFMGSRMQGGADAMNQGFNRMMGNGYALSNTMMPNMANNYYSQMMGGPMGRAVRMNAMQAGRAANSGMGSALAGSGLMHGGLGLKMRGLAGSVGFNQLSQGQNALNQLAWQQAGQNFNNMLGGAMNYGGQMGMMADQRKWGTIGAGFGGLGTVASKWMG